MLQQDQLVNTWHSATDKPNVLVVGSGDAIYVTSAMALKSGDHPCEVVCLDSLADALRLLRRGSIALVVMPESPAGEGAVELILEGLGKTRPPRFVIAVSGAPKPCTESSPLIRLATHAPASMRDAMLMALTDYERGVSGNLSVRMLLEASAGFPDQLWLKVCNEEGEFCDLCLNAGRIVYAECGRLSGAAAAEKVLSWKNCLYESRELPAFLQSNMSCWLRELGRLYQPDSMASAPVAAVQAAAPVQEEEIVDFEEPTELATLGPESAVEAPVAPAVAPVAAVVDAASAVDEGAPEEPAEPSFDFAANDEISIEEPLDMALEMDEDGSPLAEPEEPELFEFDGAIPMGPVSAGENFEERVFAATAVIAEGSSHLENCKPDAEAVYFDTLAMRELYDLSIRCSQRQQIGVPQWVQVASEKGTIVIAPIPGGRRLVAVRLRDSFEERERLELQRLQQSLEHSCNLV